MARIGHSLSREEIMRRINEHWDFICGFPIPKFDVKCPICGAHGDDIIIRQYHFFRREMGGMKYRCDVWFKCTRCSLTWVHGVVIPESIARMHGLLDGLAPSYHWREVLKRISICLEKK